MRKSMIVIAAIAAAFLSTTSATPILDDEKNVGVTMSEVPKNQEGNVAIAVEIAPRYYIDATYVEAGMKKLLEWITEIVRHLPIGMKKVHVRLIRVDHLEAVEVTQFPETVDPKAIQDAIKRLEAPIVDRVQGMNDSEMMRKVREKAFPKIGLGYRPDVTNVLVMITFAHDYKKLPALQFQEWARQSDIAVMMVNYAKASPVIWYSEKLGEYKGEAQEVTDPDSARQIAGLIKKVLGITYEPPSTFPTPKPEKNNTGPIGGLGNGNKNPQGNKTTEPLMQPWLIGVIAGLIVLALIVTGALIGYFAVVKPRRHRHHYHAKIAKDKASKAAAANASARYDKAASRRGSTTPSVASTISYSSYSTTATSTPTVTGKSVVSKASRRSMRKSRHSLARSASKSKGGRHVSKSRDKDKDKNKNKGKNGPSRTLESNRLQPRRS